jgi:tripartite-type tricarboxylate transporter receptor subunit TctC
MTNPWSWIPRVGVGLVTLAVAFSVLAFPTRPITLIVPYSPGGASEVAARAVAERMAKALGQPVVVDNRPGAEGAIAVKAGIAAEPDGHTLVLVAASMFALPLSVTPPPFDVADLVPVSNLGDVNFGLLVPASLPVRSTQDLIAHARNRPEPLAYASISLAMDALSLGLARAAGVDMTRVPYKGGPQAMTDLVGGRLQVFLGPIGNGLALAREGRVRLLATHPHRTSLAPDVPTLAESGLASAATPLFMLIAAPTRTPAPIVQKLARAIHEALQRQEVRDRFESLGITPMSSSPEAAAGLVRQALQAYAPVVRSLEANAAAPAK